MKGTEIIKNTYLHMKELIDVIEKKTSLEMGWFNRCKEFVKDLKTWKPEVYLYVKDGIVLYAAANCDMHFNQFVAHDEFVDGDPEVEQYAQKLKDWNEDLDDMLKRGQLKQVL